jgi:YHS domain-containing protein
MKPATLITCICLISPTALVSAQDYDSGSHTQQAAEPVNTMCPIGKEPIVPSAGTVEYKGKTIGLCCPGCGEAFLAWNEARKDEFIVLAVAGHEPGAEKHGQPAEESATGAASPGPSYPYTLPDCPVGGPLGSMGDPVVKVYDNREVRFCCAGCIEEFEGNEAKYWGQIDEKIVEQQLMHYPIDTCIVTGEKLGANAVNHVHNNRLVRLASADAVAAFKTDPKKYLDALDKRIIDSQLPGYPMDNCPVGGPLGSMGEPVNFIYMNRLVRLCCGACERSIATEPAKYMAKLDAAYADQQRDDYALDTCVVTGAKLGSMGDPVELVAGTRLVRFCCAGCLPKFKANPAEFLVKLPQD